MLLNLGTDRAVESILFPELLLYAVYVVQAFADFVLQTCTFVFCKLHSFRPDFLSIVCDVSELSCLVLAIDFQVVPSVMQLLCASFAVMKIGLCLLMEHFGLHPMLTVAQQAYLLDIERSNGGVLGLKEQDSSQGHEQSKLRELLFASSSCSWAFIQIPRLTFVHLGQ